MFAIIKKIRHSWLDGSAHTAFAAFCAHSVSISIGICQAYSAILIPQLILDDDLAITSEESSWLASLGAVTNPVGSILSGVLAEYLGCKLSMVISCIPFTIGWICIAVAQDIWWLYTGRLITGIAAGMSTACYTYVAEICTPDNRGPLQALGPVMASFGILLTYSLGSITQWNVVALISIAFSIFSLISILLVPESPSYLFKKDKYASSLESLKWLRRNDLVAHEEYSRRFTATKQDENVGYRSIYFSASTLKPFLILVTLFFLQEMSGVYTILFYAVNFFQDSNLDVDEHLSAIILGLIRFVMSIFAALLINHLGRKKLLMVSSLGMAVTMLLAVGYFKYYEIFSEEAKVFPAIPLIFVLFNVVFSMIGMLPIPWILVGELLPLRVRPIMGGIVICIAQSFIFIYVKIYHNMNNFLNFSGTLFVFFLAASLCFVFSWFLVPETKNQSLEEVERSFKDQNKTNYKNAGNESFEYKIQTIS